MSSAALVRGMGSFFKECEHPRSRWSKCSHPYKVRYRSAAGKQVKESGFATQDRAIACLTEVYNAKKAAPRGQAKAERIATYGAMRFEEYAAEWKAAQRDLGPASMVHLESLLNIHLLPLLGSRRMNTFDHKVVEGFHRSRVPLDQAPIDHVTAAEWAARQQELDDRPTTVEEQEHGVVDGCSPWACRGAGPEPVQGDYGLAS